MNDTCGDAIGLVFTFCNAGFDWHPPQKHSANAQMIGGNLLSI